MDKFASVKPTQTYRNIAEFITAKELPEDGIFRRVSLLFVRGKFARSNERFPDNSHCLRQLCLHLKHAIYVRHARLYPIKNTAGKNMAEQTNKQENIINRPLHNFCRIQIKYFIRDFFLLPKENQWANYSVYLIHLPEDIPSEEILTLVKKYCILSTQFFKEENTDINAILWQYSDTQDHIQINKTTMRERQWESLAKLLPQYRLGLLLYDSSSVTEIPKAEAQTPLDLRQNIPLPTPGLKVLVNPTRMSYLLKGWARPELRAKGLFRHPDFRLLSDWNIEDIQQICHRFYKSDD
ncbi:hypothetical protein P0082_07670 [Candidatus Haliotispira prima]|uniref:Uncharacterized protein n=1 Tax=Candidatus Haliotispira prima TaxID=3034016 RepID=A0ABY8MEL9_9SPIO|nr:hypothetical protein P0082_07670 [Candidatus Haliotispira prima]